MKSLKFRAFKYDTPCYCLKNCSRTVEISCRLPHHLSLKKCSIPNFKALIDFCKGSETERLGNIFRLYQAFLKNGFSVGNTVIEKIFAQCMYSI